MSFHDEDRRAKLSRELLERQSRQAELPQELLERQRWRASFSSWFMLGLGLGILLLGAYIGLGNMTGDVENGPAGLVLKKLHGPVPTLLWVPIILFCFRQFRRDRARVKELEDCQVREQVIRHDPNLSAEDAIRLLQRGAGPPTPLPEKPQTTGILIRVQQNEREMKSINTHVRRGLPPSFKAEDPREK